MTLVSDALNADLRRALREHPVQVWLDRHEHYTTFVNGLIARRAAGDLPFPVLAWRGSYLQLMLDLEGIAPGVDPTPVLVHLPGMLEEEVRLTPLLELYAQGNRYRIALDTLVKQAAAGQVAPAAIEAFLEQPQLTLEAADAWLRSRIELDVVGLAARLRQLSPAVILDDLLHGGPLTTELCAQPAVLVAWLEPALGLPSAWVGEQGVIADPRTRAELLHVLVSWALAVEYANDRLTEPHLDLLKPARTLPGPVIETCRQIARHLRTHHEPEITSFYVRTADETELFLTAEREAARAVDLGRVDTFRFEEDKILDAALQALDEEAWPQVLDWATPREQGQSIWLRLDPTRSASWQLLGAAARLGAALEAAGPRLQATTLTEALQRYTQRGAAVDGAHRALEQHRTRYPELSRFPVLTQRMNALRDRWRHHADAWAHDFSLLCKREGFLPPANLQQRTLFDQVVRPLATDSGVTAYFMVDALRYEMAVALRDALGDPHGGTLTLEARYAELPTLTDVGMNALTPLAEHGRLTPVIDRGNFLGFHTGEFQVRSPDTRRRVLHDRVGGSTCPWLTLKSVLEDDLTTLRDRIKNARLVVVHSQEIDSAGEKGVGLSEFEPALRKLRAAVGALREAGVTSFVITADHGFLLSGDVDGPIRQSRGARFVNKRRHVIVDDPVDEDGTVRVPMSELGYTGTSAHLLFPHNTAVFDQGDKDMSFVHGGNSLQERVIPVLTLVHRRKPGERTERWAIEATPAETADGLHALTCRVQMLAQGGLAYGGPPEIEVALRVVDDHTGVVVELCQARGEARLRGASAMARVDSEFTLLFKLKGPDARVQVMVFHPGASHVDPAVISQRYAVGATGRRFDEVVEPGKAWLADLPAGGVRQVFEHLAVHGAVTEAELGRMLGEPRNARKFALGFDGYVALAPFDVRIEVVGGVKRYVRQQGTESR